MSRIVKLSFVCLLVLALSAVALAQSTTTAQSAALSPTRIKKLFRAPLFPQRTSEQQGRHVHDR